MNYLNPLAIEFVELDDTLCHIAMILLNSGKFEMLVMRQ